jgi:hypothetical protein
MVANPRLRMIPRVLIKFDQCQVRPDDSLKFMNNNTDFKIVLLHDDHIAKIRGTTILEQLADQLEFEPHELDTDIWNFKLLRRLGLCNQATPRIMEANMVIISAAGNADLPVHIRNLLEIALSLRHDRKAALVVLLDWERTADGELPPLGQHLRDLAAKLKMEFFCNRTIWQARQQLL